MTTPTKEQILAAEQKAAASRERTRMAVYDLQATRKAKVAQLQRRIAQPSTLAYALAIGIVIGKTLLRRRPERPVMPRRRSNEQLKGKLAASIAAIVSRFGWRFLSGALLRMWSSRMDRPRLLPPPRRPAPAPTVIAPSIHSTTRSAGETVH